MKYTIPIKLIQTLNIFQTWLSFFRRELRERPRLLAELDEGAAIDPTTLSLPFAWLPGDLPEQVRSQAWSRCRRLRRVRARDSTSRSTCHHIASGHPGRGVCTLSRLVSDISIVCPFRQRDTPQRDRLRKTY